MKQIKLQKISLVNFKGIKSLDLDFSDGDTLVCGENGSGKTTVFDAFLWCMFGKDSTNRSDSNFCLKTLDADGMPILRLEHSVTCLLSVDGKEIKLQRGYKEVWTKPRGTTEETLTNHKTEFYVNDVKLGTKKEYESTIAEIIDEDVFRMITNPFAFTSLSADRQKEMLMDMAGAVTDEELAAMNPAFVSLMAEISGKPLATFLKEISAKKKACKDALAVIPSQIQTAQNLMPEAEDWDALQAEINAKLEEMHQVDEQIADKAKLNDAEYQRKAQLQAAISDAKMELNEAKNAVKFKATAGRQQALSEIKEMEYKIQGKNQDLSYKQRTMADLQTEYAKIGEALDNLRADYRTISARVISFSEDQFVCPTCKRQLEIEDIEAKQAELTANFNREKAQDLMNNQEKGKALKAKYEGVAAKINVCKSELAQILEGLKADEAKLAELKAAIPEAVNVEALIAADKGCIDLQNEITELENQLKVEAKPVDVTDLRARKVSVNDALQALYKRAAKRDQIKRAEDEIKALEEKQMSNNQALADLENWEFQATAFQKAKDEELLKRINGLFQFVSFSFVSAQLNGGEKLTCVCTVNGTPYPDVNNAGKINAGLDIINAICNAKGVCAPIFVDNAESVNEIQPTLSQKILLYVSNDSQLTVKSNRYE